MLLCLDATFHLEVAALMQMHGASGHARLERLLLACLPAPPKRWNVDRAKQLTQAVKNGPSFRWKGQDAKNMVEALLELLGTIVDGGVLPTRLVTSAFMKKVFGGGMSPLVRSCVVGGRCGESSRLFLQVHGLHRCPKLREFPPLHPLLLQTSAQS